MSKLGRYSADRKKVEALITTKTVEVSDCGTLFTLGLAGGFTVTLPTTADAGKGWWCKFIVKVAPTTAYLIKTSGSENVVHGTVVCSAGGNEDETAGTAADSINFIASTSAIGDTVELVCDGTFFYARANTGVAGGITYTVDG